MFQPSKYATCYWRLIERAKSRRGLKKCEKHHVIPRSLGGDNTKSNVVRLTPREHYICHLLLVRMTEGRARSKMIFAFFRFNPKNSGVTTSKSYARFVDSFRHGLKGEANHFFGKKHTSETKAKISLNHGMRGRSCYDVWLEEYGIEEADRRLREMLEQRSRSLSGSGNPMFGLPRSPSLRAEHAQRMTGSGNPNWGKDWAWVHKDGKTKRVLSSKVQKFLDAGWGTGRKALMPNTG
jgi:hypothetical protein